MRLSKSSFLCLLLIMGSASAANAYDDSQPAKGLVPWQSSEITRLWSEAKADYAARNYDAAITTANSYLGLVEPDAQMQALLGESYFQKQLYVLAAEHLRTAIDIAKSRQQPVPAQWTDLLRQSGGGQDAAPTRTATAPVVATPTPIRKSIQSNQPGTQASNQAVPAPSNQQSAATQRALLVYGLEAQLAQAQAQALAQVRDAQTAVGRARAEAQPTDLNSQSRVIQQQRQQVQNQASAQLQQAQYGAERARADSQVSRITPAP